jgi:hypothetical protein
MTLKHAEEFDLTERVSRTAGSVILSITVTPATGAVLVYTPKKNDPIRFNGPKSSREVPIHGTKLWIQRISGAQSYDVEVGGWSDGPTHL